MRDAPAGDTLLDAARQALLAEVVPTLSGRQRYVALMVANAIGIASRELKGADRTASVEGALLNGAASPASLATAIRAGSRDGDGDLYGGLVDVTENAAGIWKPGKAP